MKAHDPRLGMTHDERQTRAYWKWRETAFLILRHGFTTEPVLAAAFQLSPSRVKADVLKWQRLGLVRKATVPTRREKLILLTQAGAHLARGELGLTSLAYRGDASTIGLTRIGHNLAVQLAAITYDKRHENHGLHQYDLYQPEAKCKGCASGHLLVDALIQHGNRQVLLEVELSRKNPKRLREKMESMAGILSQCQGIPTWVVWITYKGQMASALKHARDDTAHWESNGLENYIKQMVVTCPAWLDTYPYPRPTQASSNRSGR